MICSRIPASTLACEEKLRRLEERKREETRLDCPNVPRKRKSVVQVHQELGSTYFRCSFRMNFFTTFRQLYRALEEDLKRKSGLKQYRKLMHTNCLGTSNCNCMSSFIGPFIV